MDAARALADLTEISTDVERAVVTDEQGSVLAATGSGGGEELARAAVELIAAVADDVRGGVAVTQLEAATRTGSLFVVRDGPRLVAATTRPRPTAGLVFYDLRSCLRSLAEEKKPARKRAPRKKKEPSGETS